MMNKAFRVMASIGLYVLVNGMILEKCEAKGGISYEQVPPGYSQIKLPNYSELIQFIKQAKKNQTKRSTDTTYDFDTIFEGNKFHITIQHLPPVIGDWQNYIKPDGYITVIFTNLNLKRSGITPHKRLDKILYPISFNSGTGPLNSDIYLTFGKGLNTDDCFTIPEAVVVSKKEPLMNIEGGVEYEIQYKHPEEVKLFCRKTFPPY